MKKRKKSKINISELLRKHKAGKSIGSTNRARLVALCPKVWSPQGQKNRFGEKRKVIMAMHKKVEKEVEVSVSNVDWSSYFASVVSVCPWSRACWRKQKNRRSTLG